MEGLASGVAKGRWTARYGTPENAKRNQTSGLCTGEGLCPLLSWHPTRTDVEGGRGVSLREGGDRATPLPDRAGIVSSCFALVRMHAI